MSTFLSSPVGTFLTSTPTPTLAFQALLSSLAVLIPAHFIYYRYFSPVSNVPGPFWATVTRLWLVRRVLNEDLIHVLPALHRTYGKFVRIAPDEVSISDASAISTVYGAGSGFVKTDFYDALAPPVPTFLGGTFAQRDEKLHAKRVRIISKVYSMTNVVKAERYIDACIADLLEVFDKKAEDEQVIDLSVWMNRLALDVIGELFYGVKFGALKATTDEGDGQKPYMRRYTTLTAVVPRWRRLITFLCLVLGIRGNLPPLRKYERGKALVEKRQKSDLSRTDMLDSLLSLQAHQKDYTMLEVMMDSFDATTAGSDTTGLALGSILYHILKNPRVYTALQSEIDKADAEGHLSMPVKYSEAIRLPLLSAVCKEGMRMFPSVGMTLPRYVPRDGKEIAGQFFPGGVKVGLSAFVVHFDKAIFGHDAQIFNPDRWFREGASNMDRHMLEFGAGSRTCIGKNISLCEIYKLVPELLRSFKIRLADDEKPWTTGNLWFANQSGIDVVLEKRQRDSVKA